MSRRGDHEYVGKMETAFSTSHSTISALPAMSLNSEPGFLDHMSVAGEWKSEAAPIRYAVTYVQRRRRGYEQSSGFDRCVPARCTRDSALKCHPGETT